MKNYKTQQNTTYLGGMLVQCYPTPKNGGETNKKGEKCDKLAATPLNTHNPEWITTVTPSHNDGFTHNENGVEIGETTQPTFAEILEWFGNPYKDQQGSIRRQ